MLLLGSSGLDPSLVEVGGLVGSGVVELFGSGVFECVGGLDGDGVAGDRFGSESAPATASRIASSIPPLTSVRVEEKVSTNTSV